MPTLFPSILPDDDTDDSTTDGSEAGDTINLEATDGCPWCDDYDGDAVGRHAAKAHPDAWAAHQGD